MKIFNLPDLGEGLAEAEIREWLVKEGDEVKAEQPLCSVETAKAVVEVPSPYTGRIVKLYGKSGDIIKTGQPLAAFVETATAHDDAGTVVGSLEVGHKILEEHPMGVQTSTTESSRIKASPAVRSLAKELNVDLTQVTPTGPGGSITVADVRQTTTAAPALGEKLHNARRSMAINMAQAHRDVVPVTIFDRADIYHWSNKEDVTLRLIRALEKACQVEPSLNAHFDAKTLSRQLFKEINLGLAVDTPEALYVPVLKDIAKNSDAELRKTINKYKDSAKKQNFSPEDLKNLTITLSNFGTIAGRYANIIIVPPTVAILGVGKASDEVIAFKGQPAIHRILPLSLTFDHRAATGGEAVRFLAAVIEHLEK
jgi:pyruvate dehydrogenase E2 component (dihydrolipoamide acetyltransferase)